MIINDKPLDVQLSEDFESNAFSIQANDKMFGILSDKIYTYKVKAVIRESCCNAHDSHVDAKNPEPFDVHLPTRLEPWYSVRDYGVSMDHPTCMKLYSTYGVSTKTGSNDYTGCLGIGSKSPLCLVDSFKVRAFLDGEERIYSIYNDAERRPQIALLLRQETDEPNGIEISVECENRNSEFEREAIEVLQHFETKPNINLESVRTSLKNVEDISYHISTDGIYVSLDGYGKGIKAVMGNVAYNIPNELFEFPDLDGHIVFQLGSLSFDPGRENLSLDDKTVETIKNRVANIEEMLSKECVDKIEQHDTFFQKCLALKELKATRLGMQLRVSKHDDLKQYHIPEPEDTFTVYSGSYKTSKNDSAYTLPLPIARDNKVMYFIKKPRFEMRIRHFINNFSHSRYDKPTIVLLTEEQVQFMQIDAELILDLETVVPKVPRVYSNGTPCNVKTFQWNGSTHNNANSWDETTVDLADTSTVKVYCEINRFEIKGEKHVFTVWRLSDYTKTAKDLGIKVDVVYGLKTAYLKTKAFKKGNWIKVSDYLEKELKNIAPKQRYIDHTQPSGRLTLSSLILRMTDYDLPQEFSDYLSLYRKYTKQNVDIFRSFGISIDNSEDYVTMGETILNKYPLLNLLSNNVRGCSEEIVDYINSVNKGDTE